MKFGYGNVIYGLSNDPNRLYSGRERFIKANSLVMYNLPIYKEVPTVKGDDSRIAVQQEDGSYTMYEYRNGLYTGYIPIESGLQKHGNCEPFINTLIWGVNEMTIRAKIISEKGLPDKDNGETMYIFAPNGDIETGNTYGFIRVYMDLLNRPDRIMMGYIKFIEEDDMNEVLQSDNNEHENVMYAKVKSGSNTVYEMVSWNDYEDKYVFIGYFEVC